MIDAEDLRRQFEHMSWQFAELIDENAKLRAALKDTQDKCPICGIDPNAIENTIKEDW
jgi:hypothetical protein